MGDVPAQMCTGIGTTSSLERQYMQLESSTRKSSVDAVPSQKGCGNLHEQGLLCQHCRGTLVSYILRGSNHRSSHSYNNAATRSCSVFLMYFTYVHLRRSCLQAEWIVHAAYSNPIAAACTCDSTVRVNADVTHQGDYFCMLCKKNAHPILDVSGVRRTATPCQYTHRRPAEYTGLIGVMHAMIDCLADALVVAEVWLTN
jgi:hypothetical protein